MGKGPGGKTVLSLFFIGALGVGALAIYVKSDPNAARVLAPMAKPSASSDENVAVHRHHARHTDEDDGQSSDSSGVYLPEIRDEHPTLKSERTEVPDGKDPMQFVAEQTLKTIRLQGVRVLNVDVRNGVAAINFDDQIDSGMGSTQEGQFLDALELAFGQFPNVKSIEIEKEGEALDSLGHIELSGPQPVTHPPTGPDDGGPG
jgi:hypothetical protein